MLAAFHDPDDVETRRVRLPEVRVFHFKADAAVKSARLRFSRGHSGLNRADRHARYAAPIPIRQPQSGPSHAAADIEHCCAPRNRGPPRQLLHQLNLCPLRGGVSLAVVPVTVVKMLSPEHSIQERQPVVVLADANDIHGKSGRGVRSSNCCTIRQCVPLSMRFISRVYSSLSGKRWCNSPSSSRARAGLLSRRAATASNSFANGSR